jgi:hypothetical protein
MEVSGPHSDRNSARGKANMMSKSILTIERTNWIQDVGRRYRVLVDEHEIGRIGPLTTKSFFVDPGQHSVRLALPGRGYVSSDPQYILMESDHQYLVRTVRKLNPLTLLLQPLDFGAGVSAWLTKSEAKGLINKGAWIKVVVEEVAPS